MKLSNLAQFLKIQKGSMTPPVGDGGATILPAVMGVCVAKQATCRDGQSPQGGDGRKHLGVIQVGFRFAKKQTETAASQLTKGVEYKFAMFIWAILIFERVCYVIRTELY